MMAKTAMQKPVLVLVSAGAVVGAAYVLWQRHRKHNATNTRGDGKFMYDAPLPAHIRLPDEDVRGGVKVELEDAYRKDKMRHLVISSAVSPAHLKALLPIIKELFVPQKVRLTGHEIKVVRLENLAT